MSAGIMPARLAAVKRSLKREKLAFAVFPEAFPQRDFVSLITVAPLLPVLSSICVSSSLNFVCVRYFFTASAIFPGH